jgi:hypothetical protein
MIVALYTKRKQEFKKMTKPIYRTVGTRPSDKKSWIHWTDKKFEVFQDDILFLI